MTRLFENRVINLHKLLDQAEPLLVLTEVTRKASYTDILYVDFLAFLNYLFCGLKKYRYLNAAENIV